MNYETFILALKDLDNFIVSLPEDVGIFKIKPEDNGKMQIKAIGGFAMIYHANTKNIQSRELNIDIDRLTDIFSLSILNEIEKIALKHGLESDWLNNQYSKRKQFADEVEEYIAWEKTEESFQKIDLYVADIEGLFTVKLRAVHETLEVKESGRAEYEAKISDIYDLYFIFKFLNESIDSISNSKIQQCCDRYYRVIPYLQNSEVFKR